MTRFIIHVGPHKTGTSYLQEAFVQTRGQLAERGVLYPAFWGAPAHHQLLELLFAGPAPWLEQQFSELRQSGYPTVLISVEGLATLPLAGLAYLRRLIGVANEAVVAFYVRSWGDRLPSHWKQETKEGGVETLPEYLYTRVARPFGVEMVNFSPVLRRCREAFGTETLALVSYDQVAAEGLDLFAHFAATFLDWQNPPALGLLRANVSPGPAETEVIRSINTLETLRRGRSLGRDEAATVTTRYLLHAIELTPLVLREALAGNVANAVIDETSPALTEVHRQLYDGFGSALVEPRPLGRFFEPRRVEIPYVQRDYLLTPGVTEALHELHRLLYAAPA